MDKTAIKNFAVWARKKLIEDIMQKAYEIGISDKEIKEPQLSSSDAVIIGDKTLNKVEMEQRNSLVSKIREKGFNSVLEEVAYTWFNRFIALRFMEVNEYLPTGVRVLSSIEPGKNEPDIIKEALNIDLDVDRELIYTLKDNNDTETLYRYLLVKQCNALKEILPGLFEKIEDYTEILLPSNLLTEGSVIRRLVDDISEDDFKDQVEIIGWMYQYYISEKKDEVFEGLKKNIKITKENIPAATQLFTPDWIVKYMVENSLGRLWLEGHPDEELKSKWKYYLDEVEQEPEVKKQLEEIRLNNRNIKPEDIKVLDPAMGSGHILVYTFDVLFDIYKSAGYSERDIPRLILENNLYGLDIDDRAAQLAYFAVMMKARSKSRRIFREKVNLNICAIQESNGFPKEAIDYLVNPDETEIEKRVRREDVEYLINVFHDAKEYGSILEVKEINFDVLENRIEEIRNNVPRDIFELQYREVILEKIPPLIQQAKIMSQKFDVVCTNPPYMGNRGMNSKLKELLDVKFKTSNKDLFAVFIKNNFRFANENSFISMITMESWMFLSSFEELRTEIIKEKNILSLVHMPYEGRGRTSLGINFGTSAFIIRNCRLPRYVGTYNYLRHFEIDEEGIPFEFPVANNRQSVSATMDFTKIPGFPIAYWVSDKVRNIFNSATSLGSYAEPRQGLATGDNNKFLRIWSEVDINKIGFDFETIEEFHDSSYKWLPYNKGGNFRRWYGNQEFVIAFDKKNYDLLSRQGNHLPSRQYYLKESVTWSFLSTKSFSVRYSPKGFVFDVAGSSIFPDKQKLFCILGFLGSKLTNEFLYILNPTMNYQVGNVRCLPIINEIFNNEEINNIVSRNVSISKADWDSFETSWNFLKHPILTHKNDSATLEQAFNNWSIFAEKQFNQLKANEEKLNRIFIKIYGLQDELTPEVEDEDITIRKADRVRDIKSFISYAVGCMFGRYSIDAEGLIYAGGDFKDKWKYEDGQWKVRKIVKDEEGKVIEDTWVDATFIPDMDNVLPITDDEYFEDDIVSRFIEFLKVTFGEDTLEENLDYIADTLGRKSSETARQAIRRYFLKEFYKDHVQVYQKKPIYWLFDSGKQDGFKALIYMHRYDEYTVAKVRTDYLHKLQKSYEAEVKKLDIIIDSNVSQREKANAKKKKEHILKQMEECLQYDQVIAHVANQKKKIDLDDGVHANYAKFQGIEVPQGEGKKPLKADLLAKI